MELLILSSCNQVPTVEEYLASGTRFPVVSIVAIQDSITRQKINDYKFTAGNCIKDLFDLWTSFCVAVMYTSRFFSFKVFPADKRTYHVRLFAALLGLGFHCWLLMLFMCDSSSFRIAGVALYFIGCCDELLLCSLIVRMYYVAFLAYRMLPTCAIFGFMPSIFICKSHLGWLVTPLIPMQLLNPKSHLVSCLLILLPIIL